MEDDLQEETGKNLTFKWLLNVAVHNATIYAKYGNKPILGKIGREVFFFFGISICFIVIKLNEHDFGFFPLISFPPGTVRNWLLVLYIYFVI